MLLFFKNSRTPEFQEFMKFKNSRISRIQELLKRYGPLVGAKVGCGPSGALQLLAVEW